MKKILSFFTNKLVCKSRQTGWKPDFSVPIYFSIFCTLTVSYRLFADTVAKTLEKVSDLLTLLSKKLKTE